MLKKSVTPFSYDVTVYTIKGLVIYPKNLSAHSSSITICTCKHSAQSTEVPQVGYVLTPSETFLLSALDHKHP